MKAICRRSRDHPLKMTISGEYSRTTTLPTSGDGLAKTRPAFVRVSNNRLVWVGVVAWLGCSAAGLLALVRYGAMPGASSSAPTHWPVDAKIERATNRSTLVMFAHPRCPCTRSSLGELEKIMAHCQGTVSCRVVFLKPSKSADSWTQTDLWSTASSIPETSVSADVDGEEARRFGAVTSGQCLLYNSHGDLLFSGGVTAARGHSGDNVGRDSIESYLTGKHAFAVTTPVYGCPIVRDRNVP